MEVEQVVNVKFGIGECVPEQNAFPSDGMSSDATVVCLDSDAEEDEQQQDTAVDPGLERRLKEKGLQGGPEPLAKFKSSLDAKPGVELELKGKSGMEMKYSHQELLGKRHMAGRTGDSAIFKVSGSSKKISWGREQELADAEAAALAAAVQQLKAKSKKPYEIPTQGSFYLHDDRWREGNNPRNQRRKKGLNLNNNISGAHTVVKKANNNRVYGQRVDERWRHDRHGEDYARAAFMHNQHHHEQQPQQHQRGSRRRGRRGGRGRKNVEKEAIVDVPKLEKNLEEELAQEMANQASNESALAQSFSSLRLHVAGGGTMIILNDREITDGESPEDFLDELEKTPRREFSEATAHAELDECKPKTPTGTEQHAPGPNSFSAAMAALRANCRGCGAFFPPHLLAQVQTRRDVASPRVPRPPSACSMASSRCSSRLNARATPFVPLTSPLRAGARNKNVQFGLPQMNRQTREGQAESSNAIQRAAKSGTGCFIPMYSRPDARVQSPVKGHMPRPSLAESLASISDVEFSTRRQRLKLQPPPSKAESIGEDQESCADFLTHDDALSGCMERCDENVIANRFDRARAASVGGSALLVVGDVKPHKRTPTTPAEELMTLIDGEQYTTFTSPLHLEETLDGLEAEKQALEETQEKILSLEAENAELREGMRMVSQLKQELDRLKGANNALQVLLFVALARPEKLGFGARMPRGMFRAVGHLQYHELEAVKNKLATKSAELMNIQKVLEQKNEELKALSDTWLHGLRDEKVTPNRSSALPSLPSLNKEKSSAVRAPVTKVRGVSKSLDSSSTMARKPVTARVSTRTASVSGVTATPSSVPKTPAPAPAPAPAPVAPAKKSAPVSKPVTLTRKTPASAIRAIAKPVEKPVVVKPVVVKPVVEKPKPVEVKAVASKIDTGRKKSVVPAVTFEMPKKQGGKPLWR